jgi:hypothetical protein
VVDPRTTEPSYTYKNAEMRRVRRLGLALGHEEPVWSVNDKDSAHAWADQLGIRRPALIGRYDDVRQVPWEALPDSCVLKPTHGAHSRGVHLLARAGSAWTELVSHRTLTSAQVAADVTALADAGEVSRAVLVEELVQDPQRPGGPPVDWKVFTFYGRVGVISAKVTHLDPVTGPRVRWKLFDEDFADLGRAATQHQLDPSIPPPQHAEQLLDMARRISLAVPRPHLRVDLYDGQDGPVFGEITPEPGGSHVWRRDLDRALGRLWEDAEARLRVQVALAGLYDPAVHLPPSTSPEAVPTRGAAPVREERAA